MSRITAGTPASILRRQRASTSAGGAIVRRGTRWRFPPPIRHSTTACEARHDPRMPRGTLRQEA